MKKIAPISLFLFTVLSLASCGSDSTEAGEPGAVYYCPMECEGEKTYDKPGQCPVCQMDLIEKEKN